MNKVPTITVLMSVYNGEKYLRECIDSILNQTYSDFEFVIYDDCSTDSSSEIIKSYKDSRIVYRKNETNQGLTKNLKDGVEKSKSLYIARIDADDIAYPERLEKQVNWMNNHTDVSILGSAVTFFNSNPVDGGNSLEPEDDPTIKATLFISFTLLHPSIMIRRDDLVDNGINYNPDYQYSQDHALYFECIYHGLKFGNIAEPLLYMRSHSASISKASHSTQQECSKRARFNFLKKTGLAHECAESEIEVYNRFASGQFPDTPDEVKEYVSFAEKISKNPKTVKYFNKEILRRIMAQKLCNGAYHAIDNKKYRASSLASINSDLNRYVTEWSLKLKLKFYIKLLKTYI